MEAAFRHPSYDTLPKLLENAPEVTVGSIISTNILASTLQARLATHGAVKAVAVGAGSVNQAAKAMSLCRTMLKNEDIDLVVIPQFTQVQAIRTGSQVTALQLLAFDRPAEVHPVEEKDLEEGREVRVSATTNTMNLAAALATMLSTQRVIKIQSAGAASVNQAVKAIGAVRNFLPEGVDVYGCPVSVRIPSPVPEQDPQDHNALQWWVFVDWKGQKPTMPARGARLLNSRPQSQQPYDEGGEAMQPVQQIQQSATRPRMSAPARPRPPPPTRGLPPGRSAGTVSGAARPKPPPGGRVARPRLPVDRDAVGTGQVPFRGDEQELSISKQIRVSGATRNVNLAPFMARLVQQDGAVQAVAIGAAAINVTVKAISGTRYFLPEGSVVVVYPSFTRQIRADGMEVTAMQFTGLHLQLDLPETDIEYWVATGSIPGLMGAAIAGRVREGKPCKLVAQGAGAINTAMKSISVARVYLLPDRLDVAFVPRFTQITRPTGEFTGMEFLILTGVQDSPQK